MAIVRWEPFRELLSTQDRLNQLFSQTFSQFFGPEGKELGARTWAPALDIHETDHDLVIDAELPGVDPKDIDVRVENNTLFIKGERKFEKSTDEGNYHRVERSYGSFSRSLTLPSSVNGDGAQAEYRDGVLRLKLAKREEAKPKAIPINAAGSGSKAQAATASK
jgi:HSP20 family protein